MLRELDFYVPNESISVKKKINSLKRKEMEKTPTKHLKKDTSFIISRPLTSRPCPLTDQVALGSR